MVEQKPEPDGFIVSIVRKFLTSHLAIILIITSLSLGIAAILATPREEEPQIVVPVADVFVSVPGANPKEKGEQKMAKHSGIIVLSTLIILCLCGMSLRQAQGIAFAGALPDTGQTKCYNDTAEITCPAPGEDFHRQEAQNDR